MSDALTSWTNRVIELRARMISVTQTRDSQILKNSFSHWLTKSRQNMENLSLVDSFIEVQEEEMIRGKFRKWLSNTKRKIKLRELLAEKLLNDEQNLVSGVFDRWVDVYKERQLLDQVSHSVFAIRLEILSEACGTNTRGFHQEMDIVRYRTYQSLRTTLQKWKSRTMVRYSVLVL
jgi:hypothetical protein